MISPLQCQCQVSDQHIRQRREDRCATYDCWMFQFMWFIKSILPPTYRTQEFIVQYYSRLIFSIVWLALSIPLKISVTWLHLCLFLSICSISLLPRPAGYGMWQNPFLWTCLTIVKLIRFYLTLYQAVRTSAVLNNSNGSASAIHHEGFNVSQERIESPYALHVFFCST